MKIAILPDETTIAATAADLVSEVFAAHPEAVFGLATGSSPLALYRELIARYQAGEISFAQSTSFNLDEYVSIEADHPQRYRNFISDQFTSHVDFNPAAVHGPDGNAADLEQECARYEAAIERAGGIDVQILGIGSDGHIAFNEPGESFASRTHVGVLTEQTRRDNARFFDGQLDRVPTHCLTQGLGTIMEARRIVLIAQGSGKARAVKELVEGAVSAKWPATILQMHPDAWILIDEAAGAGLELADYYREVWEKTHHA